MRRFFIAIVVLAVVVTGSWFLYQQSSQEKEPPPPDYETYEVGTGDISSTVSTTGSIEPVETVNLSFKGAGRVKEVLVDAGSQVRGGDVLARLETDDLELAKEQALIGMRLAQANLDKATAGADEIDIAAAEAVLESARASAAAARASYQDLLRGPTAAQREAAEATEKRARVMLDAAQRAYNEIADFPQAAMLPQSIQLEQATIDYEVARANTVSNLASATAGQKAGALAQIAQAESAIVQAEAAVERLLKGISVEDRTIMETQVDQAAIIVKQAELALSNTELIAPIDAAVGNVNISVSEFLNPALPAIVLTNDDNYHIELNVDEIDIAQLALGQPALVNIDALENIELMGEVTDIAPLSGSGLGGLGSGTIVTYLVTVDLDDSDVPLRPGMTAAVTIITNEANDIVILPNRVMRIDRATGQPYVEKLVDGIPTRTDLIIGMRNEQFSEIVSGLALGDVLAVRRTDSGDVLRQQMFGG